MIINLFWSKPPSDVESITEWINRPVKVTALHDVTLAVHLKWTGNVVNLYTYNQLVGVPDGINVLNAADIFPAEDAYRILKSGHSIAHVSDLVRLKASVQSNGLVMDMDQLILNELPDLDSFMCSMPSKRTGGVAPQWGTAHPAIKIWDESWDGKALLGFPLKVGDLNKQGVNSLIDKIKETLNKPPTTGTKAWNFIMWGLKDIVRDTPGLVCLPPNRTNPIPSWKGSGNCYSLDDLSLFDGTKSLFGHPLPSKEHILEYSYIVGHYFESSYYGSNDTDDTFWNKLPTDCMFIEEIKHTLGPDWLKTKIKPKPTLF